ncbi:Aspartic peptidase domain containing protein, partial [Trema orientale]
KKDSQVSNFSHNKPLYVEAVVNELKFKRALVDNGSSVNIMPWQTFKAADIPENRLITQATPLVTFASNAYATKGHVNVDLQVGPLRAPTKFYVIEADVSYHLLLGRPWIHHNYAIPSTLHQCLKAVKGKKEILIPATKAPFSQEEVHWIEAVFFDEVANDVNETRPCGVSLAPPGDEERSLSASSQNETNLIEKDEPTVKRIRLSDGRILYEL